MKQDRTSLSKGDYQKLLTLEDIRLLKDNPGFKAYIEDVQKYRASLMLSAFNGSPTPEQYLELRGAISGLNFLLGYVEVADVTVEDLMAYESENEEYEDVEGI